MKCKLKDVTKHPAPWFVYIIRCKDSKLYTGITTDLSRRIQAHNSGNGCRFTRCRLPVELLYSEDNFTKPEALKREAAIKNLPRAKKLELIRLKA
ncbi:MAG: GIY-YIG nuclease family protein [Candidatus Omnitrophica bacterium]|nr:GIY-YIG nuclease family protein [Candidatus Omnitrophota bacterium]